MTNKMNPEVKAKWIEALTSGIFALIFAVVMLCLIGLTSCSETKRTPVNVCIEGMTEGEVLKFYDVYNMDDYVVIINTKTGITKEIISSDYRILLREGDSIINCN